MEALLERIEKQQKPRKIPFKYQIHMHEIMRQLFENNITAKEFEEIMFHCTTQYR